MTRAMFLEKHYTDQEKCSHEHTMYAVRVQSNGVEQVRKVCAECGYNNNLPLPHSQHPDRATYPILIKHPYSCQCHPTRGDQLARAMRLRPQPTYADYLRSPQWRDRRDYAIRRALGRCQLCNATRGLEVHHRTYDRLGAEYDADLLVLCGDCHGFFHERIGGATRREAA